jgi:hypothetical protein
MTAKRTAAADPHSAAEARPVDEAELRQEIERTREQLGETVEQLAAKTDVPGRARAKAAELAGRAKSTTAQARTRAAAQFGNARGQLRARAAPAREATQNPCGEPWPRVPVPLGSGARRWRWRPSR